MARSPGRIAELDSSLVEWSSSMPSHGDATARRIEIERLLSETSWLERLARGLVGDEHDAADVAQDARLAAMRAAPEDEEHARAWLVRVVRNFASLTRLRRRRRDARERAAARPEALPSTVELVARVQRQRRVVDAVLALDEPYRRIVLLRYFVGLAIPAIAERDGMPVETAWTRLKRAHARLRDALDREFGTRDEWAGALLPTALGTAAVGALSMSGATKVIGLVLAGA